MFSDYTTCDELTRKCQLIWSCFNSPKLPFKIAELPLKGRIFFFFKIWVVGTLNLCLKVPKKIHKTRDESDQSRLRKRPKNTEKQSKFEFG